MNSTIIAEIERWAGEPVATARNRSGGSIADARAVRLQSGRMLFVKAGAAAPGMFRKETNGLRELQKPGVIRVPEVLLAHRDFLVLEYIPAGSPGRDFFERFGRQLAALHRREEKAFGFYEDNFIGATVQKNVASGRALTDWTTFYWEYRLLFQYRLAEQNGHATAELTRLFAALEHKIADILGDSDAAPALLHGDLWSGNFLADENGEPVLIDPAVYYGHREADLAMTKLFGGFSPQFYAAYHEAYPLAEGYGYRENIYKLYHLFNHLNLFGRGYYAQTMQALRFYF